MTRIITASMVCLAIATCASGPTFDGAGAGQQSNERGRV
jgi:hypothetical protein